MLIGRDAEQQALARVVSGARVQTASALVLVGEPGIGKSALLADALAHADDMRVLRAAGSRPERDVAFAGLHQLLHPVLPLLDRLPDPQADALSVALALRDGVVANRFAVGAACLSLLSVCAEDRAVLVVIDDAHLWDRPSTEAVTFAVRRLVADPVAFLAASRPVADSVLLQAGLPELRLGGLGAEACAELVRRRCGHPLAPETVTRVLQASAGNPLALEELAGDVAAIERLPPSAPVPVPRALADTFRRRTGELAPAAQRALLLAALCDGDLALADRAAREMGCDMAALTDAESAGLVRIDGGQVLFRHPLVSAGSYADAAPATRRRAHLAVAAALPEHDLERRVWHRAAAAAGPDPVLAGDLIALGRRAANRGAHAVAMTAFERAGALLDPAGTATVGTATAGTDSAGTATAGTDTGATATAGTDTGGTATAGTASTQTPPPVSRAGCWLAAGESAWLAGQTSRAEELLARAADDPRTGPAVSGLRGAIALRAGSLETARSLLWRAAEAVADTDPAAAVSLFAELVSACFYLGAATDGLAAAHRIEHLLAAPMPDSARLPGLMAAGVARVIAGQDGIDQIRTAVTGLASLPSWADDQRRPAWTVLGPLFLRESDSGRELVRHAVDNLRARCALGTLPSLLFHTARVDATSRRWQLARTAYDEGARLARESGQTTDLAMCLAGMAWLEARIGLRADCRTHADEANDLATRHHIHLARAWAGYALGDAALGDGDIEAAGTRYAEVQRVLADIGVQDVDLSPGPELVEVLAHLGRRDEAAAAAQAYHERAVAKGQPWARARAERARGIIASTADDRDRHFRAALELHAATPDDFERARTHLAYGAALRRARRRVDARLPLREAAATFAALGAASWSDRAATELEATGETAARPGDSPLTTLTPQELHIAELLAAGRTAREAASALFLSPKTVEYHLRHIYTKLDIRSRPELVEAMSQR